MSVTVYVTEEGLTRLLVDLSGWHERNLPPMPAEHLERSGEATLRIRWVAGRGLAVRLTRTQARRLLPGAATALTDRYGTRENP